MPFFIIRGDITKIECDAIVNAANNSLLGGGGVDGAIHRAAGRRLLEECRTLGGCDTGDAKITKGYDLKAKYVIHTVGPIWRGGDRNEEELLSSCYRTSLGLALRYGCETVSFPLISSGAYGYPREEALRVASETIREYLAEHDMTVYLVIFGEETRVIPNGRFRDISSYVGNVYEDTRIKNQKQILRPSPRREAVEEKCCIECQSLADAVGQIDESFSEMLLRKIDEKGMTDSECYKKANIDRKHFSKIRNDKNYRPGKQTVLSLAIALELPLDEMKDMLMKAGFALSHSSKSDIIIEYFVKNGNYDIFEINEALFSFDQALLGV